MGNIRNHARLGAAAGVLILAGLGLATPGLARDDGKGDKTEKVEKVIVISDHRTRDGDHARGEDGPRIRAFSLDGADVACDGDKQVRELDGAKGKHTRIVICRSGERGPGHGDARVRTFAFNGIQAADCDGDPVVRDSGNDGEHRRVIICTRDGGASASPAMTAERLERLLGRINDSEQLSAEQKERVSAALREAISQLRSGN